MLFLLFVLLLTLVIRGGTSSASMLLQQEEEKLASSARRQVTNTIIEEKDVSYTIQALVLKLDNEITHSNEKKNDYYMIDHLSLIKASIEEIAKRSTTRWRRRRDEEVDAEAALLSLMGTTTNPYSRHHGQILSFEECSPYNPNNGNVDDDPSTSSATTTCLKVKARLFRHGKQQQSPASVSEQFYFPCNNHQDDDATTTNGNDFVVVVNNNVDVWNLNTRRARNSIPVRMIIKNFSSSSSSSFPNYLQNNNKKEQHTRNESLQHKDGDENSKRFQEGRSSGNNVGSNTLMTRQLAAESWAITERTNDHEDEEEGRPYYNDDNEQSTLSEQTTSTNTGKTRMVLPPSTMNGLIVGVLAMIWLLVIICGCAIYSTRHHDKYEVNDYFYHNKNHSHSHIALEDDCVTEGEFSRHHIRSKQNTMKQKMKGEQAVNHYCEEDKDCYYNNHSPSSKENLSTEARAAIDIKHETSSEGGVELVAFNLKRQQPRDSDNSTLYTEDYNPQHQNVHNHNRRTSYTSASSFSTASGSTTETKTTTVKTPWYAPPIQRQHWGEAQVLPHLNWGDIFFDLFFVGAAYNLGVFLISLADDGNLKSWPRGIMYYIGMFGSLILIWNKKTLFDSKYTVVDTLHRWSDMIRVCFLSLSMMHIEPFEIMSNPIKANTFNFMLGLTLEQFVTLAIQWEVVVRGIGSKACHIEARHTMLIQQLPILMIYLVALGVSIYSHFIGPGSLYQHTTTTDAYDGDDELYNTNDISHHRRQMTMSLGQQKLLGNDGRQLGAVSTSSDNSNAKILTEATISSSSSSTTMTLNDLPYLILFCSYMAYQISLFLYTRCYLPSKKHRKRDIQAITTPVNVEFIIHRYGEWTMLMLGESVLSLLIVDTVELRDYYIVAAAGVVMVILLQVLHFESEPSSAHTDIDGEHHDDEHPTTKQKQHALKRNKMSSLGFYYSTHLHSFALIALGASFKIMLQIVSYMFHNDASLSSPEAYHTNHDSDGNSNTTTTSNKSSLFSHNNNEEEQSTDNYITDQEHTSSNNPYRFLRHNENISHQSSILSHWLSSLSLSSNIKSYIFGSSHFLSSKIDHSSNERFLAGGTNASTQGIDDSNEVKVISANMFGISLALVLISMEFMSFSHCGFHQKKQYFQSLGILTKIAAFFVWLLRIELILAAATLSFYVSEPKWLVFGGMIIVFLSVIVKSNGKDIVLYSHHI